MNATTNSLRLTKEFGKKADVTLTYDGYKADSRYTALWEPGLKKGNVDNYDYKLIYNQCFDDTTTNQFSILNSMYDTDYNAYLTQVRTLRIADQFTKNFYDRHTLTSGFAYTQDKAATMNDVKLTNRALNIQDEWQMTERWKLTGGVRYDNNSGFGGHTTPRVN